ncbi:BspA family leucine-rich repeat surface protein [Mycoplasmopsis agalactiae]|uniref:BspA family leucine-rich repeat surface protein n=1 Tax=Mycoplasmopsis agalactiae TaxID=2110 RepID=UPI00126015EF|nr:BspA family leucine-rich repeat surface protein [Mycoplasmopsis agalactiae]KAB6718686.1 BspA family leucine-rich repeat surface protein [Mycoplasmopsis agalactiae]
MNKKIKFLSGAFLSITTIPLIAASCDNKSNNSTEIITKPQTDHMDGGNGDNKNITPPHSKTEQGDQSNRNTEDNPINKEKVETEDEKKVNKENAEKVKKIVSELKDAFAAFHSLQDFYDQINVYAKDEKINNLELAETNKNKLLHEDTSGGKNKIKLNLGSTLFEVTLGTVFKDKVVTKYAVKDSNSTIKISLDNKFDDINKTNDKIFVKQIGYSKDASKNSITIATMPKNTVEVPKNLPLKINSLFHAFHYLKSSTINNIDKWNLKNVNNISEAFSYAAEFNQDISNWDTSNVRNMSGVFDGAAKFNSPLNNWNVSNVTQMSSFFAGASSFNQDLNLWNTSNVQDMESMFQEATSFNGNIDNWNVSNVKNMYLMFGDTENFNRDLSKWKLNSNVKTDNMFKSAPKVDVEKLSKIWGVSEDKLGKKSK